MPFVNKDELEQLRDTNDALTGEVEILQGRLAVEATVSRIGMRIRDEVTSPQFQLEMQNDAEAMVSIAVAEEERQRLTRELAETLKEERYEQFAAAFRTEQGPQILKGLAQLFDHDGTYDRLCEKAEQDVKVELQAKVLDAERAKIDDSLKGPSVREGIKASILAELTESGELEDIRLQKRRALENQWRPEVHDEIAAQVEAEERLREADFKVAYRERDDVVRFTDRTRQDLRNSLEQEWKDVDIKKIAAEIKDEELNKLLSQHADLEKARLEDEIASALLLREFMSRGINTEDIPEGDVVEVYLGSTTTVDVEEEALDGYGYGRTVKKPGINCTRKLTLCSLGDGRFTVMATHCLILHQYTSNSKLLFIVEL